MYHPTQRLHEIILARISFVQQLLFHTSRHCFNRLELLGVAERLLGVAWASPSLEFR
jgi:hypothetical protein